MPALSVIPSPLKNTHRKNWDIPECYINVSHCSVVDFSDTQLTKDELKYIRLCARVDFFQLVRTALYMNEGLTFREATIKYLKAYKDAKSIHIKKL